MSQFLLFLSKLIEDSEVPTPESAGEWSEQSWDVLENIASSLATSAASKKTKRISAIPTIWAQPLLMEMSLHEERHPLREEMIAQWEGMLAAIALKELRKFPLEAKSINLGEETDESFAKSLHKLIPSDVHSLYRPRGKKNPWQEISVFLWQGSAVGMSSPSTLVCPAKAGLWQDLPWFSEKESKLVSPTEDLDWLSEEEAEQLWSWLNRLKQDLNDLGTGRGSPQAISTILNLVGDFQKRLQVGQESTLIVELVSGTNSLGERIQLGGIEVLNRPIQPSSEPSSVRLCPPQEPPSPLFIVPNPPELLTREAKPIEEQWLDKRNNQRVKPQQIRIHDNDSVHLGNLNRKQLPKLATDWKLEWLGEGKQPDLTSPQGKLVDASKLFLDEFYFIPQGGVLPGGLLPSGSNNLTYEEGKQLTPLLPINPLLLDYLTPEDLQQRVGFEIIDGQVRVKLRLPLSGVSGYEPKDYEIQKDYALNKDNALEVPILELWPNFQADGWREYYLFYWNRDQKDQTFEIRLPGQVQTASVQFPQDKSLPSRYQISQLDRFPRFLTCQDASGNSLGLILLPPPPQAGRDEPTNWIVGFDFGTSATNVMFETKSYGNVGIPTKLRFDSDNPTLELLNLKITQVTQTKTGETPEEQRASFLKEYFPFDTVRFPLASVLTTRGSSKEDRQKSQKVLDGRLYNPDISFPATRTYYHPNLKWLPEFPNFPIMFLEHLALTLSAQAIRQNARSITWCTSYPSAFSERERDNYKVTWANMIEKLNATTGIQHSFAQGTENQFNYLTESSAVAQYFASNPDKYRLANTVFIDIGGGTSDISIWEDYHPVYQCSLKIAGHDLFTQFLRQHLEVLDILFDEVVLNQTQFSQERRRSLSDLPSVKVDSLLDILMSYEGEKSLKDKRKMVDSSEDEKKVRAFQKIIQLTELGLAGLYYYVGLLLRFLNKNALYKMPQLPDVYLAGNGSRILHWLNDLGKYTPDSPTNKILRQVLIDSSQLTQGSGQTVLSPHPKDEVAFGLVSAQKAPLPQLNSQEKYYLAGEVCSLGNKMLNWHSKLELTSKLDSCGVTELEKIPEFLLSFYLAWTDNKKDKKLLILDKYDPNKDNAEFWNEVKLNMRDSLQRIMLNKDPQLIQLEPPFILGLKALLKVLSK